MLRNSEVKIFYFIWRPDSDLYLVYTRKRKANKKVREFGSLPGGGHDDGVWALVRLLNARHLGLALDPDEEGDEEGRRFSGPCLRHSDDVPVGQACKKILINQGMKGDEEGRRFSGPCLRHSDDVPVGQAYSIKKIFFMTARGNLDRIYPLSTVVSLLPSRPLSCCLFAVFSAEVFRIGDPGSCWIRIQSGSGSSLRLFRKMEKILIKKRPIWLLKR